MHLLVSINSNSFGGLGGPRIQWRSSREKTFGERKYAEAGPTVANGAVRAFVKELAEGRCAGTNNAERRATNANRFGNLAPLHNHRRNHAVRHQGLIHRLMANMANLAGRFRSPMVIVPHARRKRSRE